jgi:D-arabinose 1-dehydrogenase-like Zn-dependent alcohol dehydrogenase
LITVIGYLQGQWASLPAEPELGMKRCIIRGISVGSRQQLEQMNKAIEANDIHLVIDKKVFSLEQRKDAYQYEVRSAFFGRAGGTKCWWKAQREQKHFGKVMIMVEQQGSTIAKP